MKPCASRSGLAGEKAVDQAALPRGHVALAQALGQDRRRDGDATLTFRHVHARPRAFLEERLFDLQHAIVLRGAAQEVLRALPDEVPAQVAVDDDREVLAPVACRGDRGRFERLHVHQCRRVERRLDGGGSIGGTR